MKTKENGKKQVCPQCHGFKRLFAAFRNVSLPCELCGETGYVDDRKMLWVRQGELLKSFRLRNLRIGLREAARKYGIDAANLSRMERGIIKPWNVYDV